MRRVFLELASQCFRQGFTPNRSYKFARQTLHMLFPEMCWKDHNLHAIPIGLAEELYSTCCCIDLAEGSRTRLADGSHSTCHLQRSGKGRILHAICIGLSERWHSICYLHSIWRKRHVLNTICIDLVEESGSACYLYWFSGRVTFYILFA